MLRRAGPGREKGLPPSESGVLLPSLELLLEVELEQDRPFSGGREEDEVEEAGEAETDGGGWQAQDAPL